MSKPNILLVVLDSVRAKNCGIYDHENNTTPFLDSFVDRTTFFEQARSPSIHSISSHASIFSGYHTEEHNITEHEDYLSPKSSIWSELKNNYDYNTGIFTPNVVITESSNLSSPFQTFFGPRRKVKTKMFDSALSPPDIQGSTEPAEYLKEALQDESPVQAIINGIYSKLQSRTSHNPTQESAGFYTEKLIEWIQDQQGHWASCLNLMDAHYPYVPDDKHNLWGGKPLVRLHNSLPDGPMSKTFLESCPWGQLAALEPLYDGCIRQLDAALERLVSELKRMGEFEDTLLVITSDHGEGFGERSRVTPEVRFVDHSWGIGEELTHVPLIVKEPGQESGETIGDISTLTRFPDVVRATVNGEDAAQKFVPDDGIVVSSTCRVSPPGDELPLPEEEREPYFGPWRAVYKQKDGNVRKHAKRDGDEIIIHVRDAQVSYAVNDDDEGLVNSVFGKMTDANVKVGNTENREVSEDVEEKLANLGYLR